MKEISKISEQDRPREKMLRTGAESLSDHELLAAMLGRGTRDLPLMALADRVLKLFDQQAEMPNLESFKKIPGMGPARSAQLAAAMEFARRRYKPAPNKIRSANDLLSLIRHYADRKQEHFLVTSLNGANEIIATRVISVGGVNHVPAQPRDVFADPVADRASSIILAHNHPSGNVRPSNNDIQVTKKLCEVGRILKIPVMDHLIFTLTDSFSFKQEGLLGGV